METEKKEKLHYRALRSLPVNSGVKAGAYPQPRFWTCLTKEERSRLDLKSFFQGKSYAARIIQDEYGYTLDVGELILLITRPSKEEVCSSFPTYLFT